MLYTRQSPLGLLFFLSLSGPLHPTTLMPHSFVSPPSPDLNTVDLSYTHKGVPDMIPTVEQLTVCLLLATVTPGCMLLL